MNPEHLELYRKLSATKIYKERFGEWAVGDRYWFAYHKKIYFYDERHSESPFMKDVIWLPPVFVPERPERCLWGMVVKAIIHNNINYFLTMRATAFSDITVVCYSSLSGDVIKEYEGPLDIALIKTILAQEASHD